MLRGILRAATASKLRLAVVGLLGVGLVVGGGVGLGVLGTPSVAGVDNHFASVSEETTTLRTDLVVSNPNPIGVSADDLTVAYTVSLNDVEMASGRKEGVSVASGNSTVEFETAMQNGKIPAWWVSHVRNGEHTDLVVHATVTSGTLNETFEAPQVEKSIDTDISSAFDSTETRELRANREPVVQDPALYVNATRGEWGEVTEGETKINMEFDVHNPQPYPIYVQQVRYDVWMNDVSVGEGSTDQSYTIPPGETRTIEATTTIRNGKLDDWWVSHLRNDQVTELRVNFELVVDFSEAAGGAGPKLTVPLDSMTHTVETDVFGNKAQYPTGDAADGSDGNAGSGENDATDGDDGGDSTDVGSTVTSTATAADSATSGETATSSATDDGIVGTSTEPLNGTDDGVPRLGSPTVG